MFDTSNTAQTSVAGAFPITVITLFHNMDIMGVICESERDMIASAIRPIAEGYKVKSVYLFGSRARGEASSDSDYDFLIVPKDDMSAFQMCGLLMDLENAFGSVDLVSIRSIDGEFKDAVLKERVLVYAE